MLHTARIGDTYCRYRTVYGVELWPLAVAGAKLQRHQAIVSPSSGTLAFLQMEL